MPVVACPHRSGVTLGFGGLNVLGYQDYGVIGVRS